MKKVLFFTLSIFMLSFTTVSAKEKADSLKHVELDEITVSAVRVSSRSSVAHSNLNEQSIKANNASRNVPALLHTLPSVVTYTEGGTAVGNMSFRVRGTDANRINITLDGMPLNNPESQEVYWVNLPDLSSSLRNIQLQRGVGTASAGTASFGGNISMQTVGARGKAYADISSSFGNYNTYQGSVAAGTGILKNGFSVDARYSYTRSDGYIRNGKVDHKNLYASVAHYTDKQVFKLIYINGIQHTGITWEGISPEQKSIDRRYNPAGQYTDDDGNIRYYDNETDNYYSNILLAQYSRFIDRNIKFNVNFGYNNGYGYYENYKTDQKFSKFGLNPQIISDIEYKTSDIIRRKLMSNNLYTGGTSLIYTGQKLEATIGMNYTYFDGDHYGKLLWVKHNNNIANNYEWYRNTGTKEDFNQFIKISYSPLSQLTFTGEVQNRFVDYRLNGVDDDMAKLKGNLSYYFFNPKLGITYSFDTQNEVYASFAISNREPLRADLKESLKGDTPAPIKPERLLDYEFGYRHSSSIFSFNSNFYFMDYNNQLVQTGKLSDTGYKYQENVKDSYRYGVELEAMYNPFFWLGLGGNLTLSQNKIENYTAYFDYYDNQNDWNYLGQKEEFHEKTDISFSPDIVGSAIVKFKPLEKEEFILTFINKYVGTMYYDNTSNKDNKLSDYFTTDFQVSYSRGFGFAKKIEFQFLINNLFNKKYDANAWVDTSKFADGTEAVYKGLFPQAGTNVMGKISISF